MNTTVVQITMSKTEFSDYIRSEVETVVKNLREKEKSHEDYLMKKDVASLLCVSLPSVDKLIDQGKLQPFRVVGKRVVFKKADVLKLIKPA